jgi:hypothetical protein
LGKKAQNPFLAELTPIFSQLLVRDIRQAAELYRQQGDAAYERAAILILMLEADFSTPTKNVITLIMTE